MRQGIQILHKTDLFAFDDLLVFGFIPGIDNGLGRIAFLNMFDDFRKGRLSFADDNIVYKIVGDDKFRYERNMDAAENDFCIRANLLALFGIVQHLLVMIGYDGESD